MFLLDDDDPFHARGRKPVYHTFVNSFFFFIGTAADDDDDDVFNDSPLHHALHRTRNNNNDDGDDDGDAPRNRDVVFPETPHDDDDDDDAVDDDDALSRANAFAVLGVAQKLASETFWPIDIGERKTQNLLFFLRVSVIYFLFIVARLRRSAYPCQVQSKSRK